MPHATTPDGVKLYYEEAGSGTPILFVQVVQRIIELTGAEPALVEHVTDRPGHDRRYSLSSGKLK